MRRLLATDWKSIEPCSRNPGLFSKSPVKDSGSVKYESPTVVGAGGNADPAGWGGWTAEAGGNTEGGRDVNRESWLINTKNLHP